MVPVEPELRVLEDEAWALLSARNNEGAIAAFAQVLKKDPSNVAAFQGTIAAYRKERNFKAAADLLGRALAIYPAHAGILSERAWLALEQKHYQEAIEALESALQAHDDLGLVLWLLMLLRNERLFARAEGVLARALQRFPESQSLRTERGWLLFYQRRYDDAYESFITVWRSDHTNAPALQGAIAAQRMQGALTEAMTLATEGVRSFPNNPGVLSERAWVSFALEAYEQAAEEFELVLTCAPDEPGARTNLAWALIRSGSSASLDSAAKQARDALRLDPQHAEAYGCLGIIAFRKSRFSEAETYFRRSVEVDPARGHHTDLGALYTQMGRYQEAEDSLQRALKTNPEDPYAHSELGYLLLQSRRVDEAVRELRVALALDPRNPDGVRNLAIGLLEQNKANDAERLLLQAIARLDEAKTGGLYLVLCRLRSGLGDATGDEQFYEEALCDVGRAIRLSPNDADAYVYSGIVRAKLGDYRGAVKYFRLALKKDPTNIEAELNIKRARAALRKTLSLTRGGWITSGALGTVFLAQLVWLWIMNLRGRIDDKVIMVLVPIILGLMVVAVVLPWLSRLKLTGLEADLKEPSARESATGGPKGEIAFGTDWLRTVHTP